MPQDRLCNDGGRTLAQAIENDELPYIKCRLEIIAKKYTIIVAPHLRKQLAPGLPAAKKALVDEVRAGFFTAINLLEDAYVPLILEYQWAPEAKELSINPETALQARTLLNCNQYSGKNPADFNSCKQIEAQLATYLYQAGAVKSSPITQGYKAKPAVPEQPTQYQGMPAKVTGQNALQMTWAASRTNQQRASRARLLSLMPSAGHPQPVNGRVEPGYRILTLQTSDDVMLVKEQAATVGNGVVTRPSTFLGAGTGLFASKQYLPGQFITQFSGTIIDSTDADKLEKKGRGTHVAALRPGHWYVSGLRTAIFTEMLGLGGASYANDNIFRCESLARGAITRCSERPVNGELVVVTTHANVDASAADFNPNDAIIMLVATRSISVGEEILVRGQDVLVGMNEG